MHPAVIKPAEHAEWRPDKMGKSTIYQSPNVLVGLNAFEPGQSHSLHAHAGMDKVYQAIEGEGVFLLEGMTTGRPHRHYHDGSLLEIGSKGEYAMGSRVLITTGLIAAVVGLSVGSALAQQVTKPEVSGIRNLARLETTVACAGATAVEAVPEIKKMGFASIINLREASEAGAELEREEAAAKAVGIRYFHVPFNGGSPNTKAADQFLAAITSPGAEPAFIHCSGGNRAATMWLIKRIAVDRWDVERATQEAIALGQTSAALRQFAIDYALAHRR